ncbi:MAG TPA: hypothetical protein VKH64_17170 [Candidatus Binatia bacterium]|nr:hypothetical protein [Candidatus Binatia bacterium]
MRISTVVKWIGAAALAATLAGCGGDKKDQPGTPTAEAAIGGTISLDAAVKDKAGKTPLLMIIASSSSDPKQPAVIVKRVSEASFPYSYKLTAEDITLVGTTFAGNMYVSARIDPAGMVGPPQPGTLEGVYAKNPVPVGSANIDIVINKAY